MKRRTPALRSLLLLLWAFGLLAADDFALEARLSERLGEVGLYDYAQLHVETLRRTGADTDAVSVLEAEVLAAQGKRTQAVETLRKIRSSSNYFPQARLRVARLSSDVKEQVAAYQDYFKKEPEPPESEAACKDWQGAVMRYADALKRDGQTEKVEPILKMLEKGCGKGDGAISDKMVKLIAVRYKLDALEASGKKPSSTVIGKIITELESLQWNMDFIAAMAYVEIARATLLGGDPKKAMENLAVNTDFLVQMDIGVKKDTGSSAQSPLAGAFFVIGRCYETLAMKQKAGSPERKKLLAKAYKKYRQVAADYGDSPVALKALEAKDRASQALGGVREQASGESLLRQQQTEQKLADAQYRAGDYKRAAELYLKALNTAPGSRLAPDILYFASTCFRKVDKMLEAVVLTQFLAEHFPESKHTGNALYNLGVVLWKQGLQHAKAGKDQQAASSKGDAVRMFKSFAEANPTHLKAPFAAYTVATEQYAAAAALKEQRKSIKDVKERNANILAMRQAYRDALPSFQFVVDNYGSSDYALKSLYRLGWIYRILTNDEETEEDEDQLAVDNFLLYCERDTNATAEKITAKYQAADRLYSMGQYEQARKHFDELTTWAKQPDFAKLQQTGQFAQNATAMVAWCLDQQVGPLREQVDALEAQIAALPVPEGAEVAEIPAELADKRDATRSAWNSALQTTIRAFKRYLDDYPKDEVQCPSIMAKLGAIYTADLEDSEKGETWFETLAKTFPDSEAAKQSVFTLGRVYIKNGNWKKANQTFTTIQDAFKEYSYGNLYYLSRQPLQPASESKPVGINPELAIACNEALLGIARNTAHEDHAKALERKDLISLRVTDGYVAMEQFDKALQTYDSLVRQEERKKQESGRYSSFYFRVRMGEANAYRSQKNIKQAADTLNSVLSMINATSYPNVYYQATCELAETLADSQDQKHVLKAVGLFKQAIEFAPRDNPDIRPYIERAFFGAAWNLSRLNMTDDANATKTQYLNEYRDGQFRKEIYSLPSPEFLNNP